MEFPNRPLRRSPFSALAGLELGWVDCPGLELWQ